MFVTVIEFESQAVMIGALGLTVSLISYPLVFIRKVGPGRRPTRWPLLAGRPAAGAQLALRWALHPAAPLLLHPGGGGGDSPLRLPSRAAITSAVPGTPFPQAFLDDSIQQLQHNPDFKGILN
jgi:hypothetical protein